MKQVKSIMRTNKFNKIAQNILNEMIFSVVTDTSIQSSERKNNETLDHSN